MQVVPADSIGSCKDEDGKAFSPHLQPSHALQHMPGDSARFVRGQTWSAAGWHASASAKGATKSTMS